MALSFVCTAEVSLIYCAVVYLEKLQELFTCPLHSKTVGQNEHHLARVIAKRQRAGASMSNEVAADVV